MSSTYCTATTVENVFGYRNVHDWADLDGEENAALESARITRAIAIAGEIIDSHLSISRYTRPLITPTGDTPTIIEELAATLAGIYLYEGRGDMSIDPQSGQPVHRYSAKREWAYRMLDELRDGKRVIDAR